MTIAGSKTPGFAGLPGRCWWINQHQLKEEPPFFTGTLTHISSEIQVMSVS